MAARTRPRDAHALGMGRVVPFPTRCVQGVQRSDRHRPLRQGHYEYSTYGPDGFEGAAFEFLDRQKESGKPFLLYCSTPLVHTPHTPTPDSESWDMDFLGRFGKDTSNFRDMVAYLDKKVGRMVRRLKENGQWDNTIFIFTSDNGTSTRIVSQMADGTLRRGGKGDPRGVGTSVPLIVCWGDRIAPRVSERLADFTDFFPTFADAMRIGIPAEWKLDGVSLYPEIAGQKPLEKEISLMHSGRRRRHRTLRGLPVPPSTNTIGTAASTIPRRTSWKSTRSTSPRAATR